MMCGIEIGESVDFSRFATPHFLSMLVKVQAWGLWTRQEPPIQQLKRFFFPTQKISPVSFHISRYLDALQAPLGAQIPRFIIKQQKNGQEEPKWKKKNLISILIAQFFELCFNFSFSSPPLRRFTFAASRQKKVSRASWIILHRAKKKSFFLVFAELQIKQHEKKRTVNCLRRLMRSRSGL